MTKNVIVTVFTGRGDDRRSFLCGRDAEGMWLKRIRYIQEYPIRPATDDMFNRSVAELMCPILAIADIIKFDNEPEVSIISKLKLKTGCFASAKVVFKDDNDMLMRV